MVILGLENPIVQRNLIHKVHDEMEVGSNFINSYLSNYLKEHMIASVIEESFSCIILLDKYDTVHYINDTAYSIFQVGSGDTLDQKLIFTENLIEKREFRDEIITYNNSNYLAEKAPITLLDEEVGNYIVLQDEKGLRDTENKLTEQLKKSGFYAKYNFSDIIHNSDSMKQCLDIAKKVSQSEHTILIRGDSGTGKELLSQSIHNYSSRKNGPFVAVNCAALPESLLESELFGYEKGSFTGAMHTGNPCRHPDYPNSRFPTRTRYFGARYRHDQTANAWA